VQWWRPAGDGVGKFWADRRLARLRKPLALITASVLVAGLAFGAVNVAASSAGTASASFPDAHHITLRWHAFCPIAPGSDPAFHYWYVDVVLRHTDGATQGSGPLDAQPGSTHSSGAATFAVAPDPPGATSDTIHWKVTVHCGGPPQAIGSGSVDVTSHGVSSPGGGGGSSGGSSGGSGTGGVGGGSGSGGEGTAVCLVPDLIGKTLAAAKAAITKSLCTFGKLTRKHAAQGEKGRVLSQKPRAGTRKPAGAKVELVLGS